MTFAKYLHPIVHTSLNNLNLTIKYLLVKVGFLALMYLFSSCSRRMTLVLSTYTKLDKSHYCVSCLVVIFDWAFAAVLISFCTILCSNFQGKPNLGRPIIFPVPWNLSLLEISSSLVIGRGLIFLTIFTIFIFISLEFFAVRFDVRIFTIFQKEIFYILAVEHCSALTHCILIALGSQKLLNGYFLGGLAFSPLIHNPYDKYND